VIFLSVVLGVWTLQHVYVGWRLAAVPLFAPGPGRSALLIGLVIGFATYPCGRILYSVGAYGPGRVLEYCGAVWMGALFLIFFALVAVDLVTLGGLVFEPVVVPLRAAAAVVALAAAAAAWWGGLQAPRIVHHEVAVRGLSAAAEGLTIAHLTDLHLGTILGDDHLRRVIELNDSLDPDVVVITGDLVDGDAGVVEKLLPRLRTLRAPDGVFAVLGNHEYYAGRERSRRLLRDAGYTVLDNAAVEVRPGVWIAGVPDAGGSAQTGAPEADLGAALRGVPSEQAIVLLQHSPEGEPEAASSGVDLMLNGHTHGGQIWPFHLLVKTRYPSLCGRYRHGSMTQLVSRGAGTWGPPMRLFAGQEILLITLRSPVG
jgi:predicted MPP superfamily phosphohydrolase